MKLRLSDESRVMVTVRSKGVLGALSHEPTFRAKPQPLPAFEVDAAAPIDVAVDASIPVAAFEPPADASAFDRKQMMDNLRGKDVLDAGKWPALTFRGRYAGTLERGKLEGELVVRGAPRQIALDVSIAHEGPRRRARATWRGTLTDLGVKPFKALLGALRLHDEARIELDLVLDEV